MTGSAHDGIAVEPRILGVYLNDHLAGSMGGSERFQRLADVLGRTPVGPLVADVAAQVTQEREELSDLVERCGLTHRNPVKQVLVLVGERVARLKAVRSRLRRSAMDTLLEVELLRSALVGKLGVWETLVDAAAVVDLDPAHCAARRDRTREQVATMDRVHAHVRGRALAG